MESQEGHKLALELRGKRAKPHRNRTDSVWFSPFTAVFVFFLAFHTAWPGFPQHLYPSVRLLGGLRAILQLGSASFGLVILV
jgi:hypothetical protein